MLHKCVRKYSYSFSLLYSHIAIGQQSDTTEGDQAQDQRLDALSDSGVETPPTSIPTTAMNQFRSSEAQTKEQIRLMAAPRNPVASTRVLRHV